MSLDSSIYSRILPYVKNFTTAIDVGAHKGVWTDRMYMHFESIICFEPNAYLFDALSTYYGNSNIIVHNVALLDIIGKGRLCHDLGKEHKTRAHYVVKDDNGDIEISTLDSYKIDGCGLLKIDVEGGELPVLYGARRILRHQHPVVVVEYKPTISIRYGWTDIDLYRYMLELEYNPILQVKPNIVFVYKRKYEE